MRSFRDFVRDNVIVTPTLSKNLVGLCAPRLPVARLRHCDFDFRRVETSLASQVFFWGRLDLQRLALCHAGGS